MENVDPNKMGSEEEEEVQMPSIQEVLNGTPLEHWGPLMEEEGYDDVEYLGIIAQNSPDNWSLFVQHMVSVGMADSNYWEPIMREIVLQWAQTPEGL